MPIALLLAATVFLPSEPTPVLLSPGKANDNDADYDVTGAAHSYVIDGDVMLGVILSLHEHDERESCGQRLRELDVVQLVEAVSVALRQVNAAAADDDDDSGAPSVPRMPPGVSLGAVVVDDCASHVIALGRALQFLPFGVGSDCEGTSKPERRKKKTTTTTGNSPSFTSGGLVFYDVVGVIGPESSSAGVLTANLFGMFRVPQISPTASCDELSNKNKYPYFLRMAPPDRYQVAAMLSLMRHFRWNHVAVVYSRGSYGESAAEQLKGLAAAQAVCVAATLAVSRNPRPEAIADVVTRLRQTKVKVVVLFTDQEETRAVLAKVKAMDLVGRFVWIGSDAVGLNLDDLDGLEDVAAGALTLSAFSNDVTEFRDHFESLIPSATRNPWFRKAWTERCGNASEAAAAAASCSGGDQRDPGFELEPTVPIIMDSVYVFAAAVRDLLRDLCPDATGSEARSCITGTVTVTCIL